MNPHGRDHGEHRNALQFATPVAAPAYQADGQPCTTERFLALACDPSRSVVVEACAGAGKTWILVSRILRALLDGASPGEILAITFTRKAAGEMRARLHQWLNELTQASAETRIQALVERGLELELARRAEAALASLHSRILAGGELVQISTFHAWFAQLLRLAPLELLDALGLHSSMSLIEDIEDYQAELMRRFQRAVLDEPMLLADYTALTHRHGRAKLADWLVSTLAKRTEIESADALQPLEQAIEPAAALWPNCVGLAQPADRLRSDPALRHSLRQAAVALGASTGKRARDAGAALALALETLEASAAFEKAWEALFTQGDTARALGDLAAAHQAVEAMQALAQQVAQHDAHVDQQRMARLARVLLAHWRELKRERSLVDMPDLERCALAVLSDSALAGWVQERLDVRVRHLLIDEFQDTSPLQWHALQGWLSSYAGAGGGSSGQRPLSVFIVGDPKQSIYRFRRAEPRVFNAAREFVVTGLAGHQLECNHTRRCAPSVVACVNAVFLAAAAQGEYAGFHAHSTEVAAHKPGRVFHLAQAMAPLEAPALETPRDTWRDSLTVPRVMPKEPRALDEARRVARAVQTLVANGQYRSGDIMILARRRAALRGVVDQLRALDLPCVAAEDLRLADLAEVGDLDALLDVLASHGHDLSLARALKSPLFGASDAELLALSQRAALLPGSARWWHALQSWTQAPAALERARELLARWAGGAQTLPPHDLLDQIVDQGDLMARLASAVPPERRAVALAAVNALLSLSLALDGGRYSTVYRFVRALRQRALSVAAPSRVDAIRLMTIHGAKGLQARCVFVVDTDANPMHEARPTVMVDWPLQARAPRRVAFVVNARRPPQSLAALREADGTADAREGLNALYVAMTRASDMLVFSRTAPHNPRAVASWWSRVVAHTAEFAQTPIGANTIAPEQAPPRVPMLVPATVARDPVETSSPNAARDDQAARLGQAIHRTLQWAAATPASRTDLNRLAVAAAHEFELADALVERVSAVASTMLHSAELAAYFDASGLLWSGDEVDVSHGGQVLRIDRLVRLGPPERSAWWVLDYKLDADAIQNPSYRAQLARYRDAVRTLVGAVPVHAAFATADGRLHELN